MCSTNLAQLCEPSVVSSVNCATVWPCARVFSSQSDRTDLIDIDNQRMIDISGSYGVNVIGTTRYKQMVRAGLEQVEDLGLVLGPISPLVRENIEMLTQISGKEEVLFLPEA